MENTGSIWGKAAGKIIAALLALAFVCGAVSLCMVYEQNRDILLDVDEIKDCEYKLSESGEVIFKFRMNKPGYSFTDVDSYREDDRIVLRLYGSLTDGDYKQDSVGFYTLKIAYNKDDKGLGQEGVDGNVSALYTILH